MPIYCGTDDSSHTIEAFKWWLKHCLLENGSVFLNKRVWTKENIDGLADNYVGNYIEGTGKKLYGKLRIQLKDASQMSKILAAELTWLMLLCPSSVGVKNKRASLSTIFSWAGLELDLSHYFLQDEYLFGIGHAGVGFNNHRWRELTFAILLIQNLLNKRKDVRIKLLSDESKFKIFLESEFPEHQGRQFRHMFLYMLFPERNERIFSGDHRRQIVHQLGLNNARADQLSNLRIDDELFQIRSYYEIVFSDKDIDFYVPPLANEWEPNKPLSAKRISIHRPFITSANDSLTNDISSILDSANAINTEAAAHIIVRIGQGTFRAKLLEYWNYECAITKYDHPSLLIASHIKPWRDSNSFERLDYFNGLLLTANIDRAFDNGLITFRDNGNIILSDELNSPEKIGLDESMILDLDSRHLPYLKYHRDTIFKK